VKPTVLDASRCCHVLWNRHGQQCATCSQAPRRPPVFISAVNWAEVFTGWNATRKPLRTRASLDRPLDGRAGGPASWRNSVLLKMTRLGTATPSPAALAKNKKPNS